MTYGTINVDQVTNSDGITSGGLYGFKNRIINGAMMIDQRNTGAAISSFDAAKTYTVDRFFYQTANAGRFSGQQNQGSVTTPAGYTKYYGFTSLGANAPGSTDYGVFSQAIEGLNVQDLGWGTANAQTVTLSFWVRSSITGTQSVAILNASSNRSYSQTYTIASANTWQQVTITIPGDTSGTWATDNTTFAYLRFPLSVGTSNLTTPGSWQASNSNGATGTVAISATNGATFYITGVQLEKGSTATSFDYRPYGTELALCQRYLPCFNATGSISTVGPTVCPGTTAVRGFYYFKTTPRVPPTGIVVNSVSYFTSALGSTGFAPSAMSFEFASNEAASIACTVSGATVGQAGQLFSNASGQIQFTGCEL